MTPYPENIELFIDGIWRSGRGVDKQPILNPATEEQIGSLQNADPSDLDEAIEAAARGYETSSKEPPQARANLIRRAAVLLREGADRIAHIVTLEQGKPLAESKGEVIRAQKFSNGMRAKVKEPTVEPSLEFRT